MLWFKSFLILLLDHPQYGPQDKGNFIKYKNIMMFRLVIVGAGPLKTSALYSARQN
jgi:hypothetical protein